MELEFYPSKEKVEQAKAADDPLLVLVAFDESKILVSNIDDSFEHVILLRKLNYAENDLDRFYRIVLNRKGADWTFVCPADYKGIKDRNRRIESYYNDGIVTISRAIIALGYPVPVNIPERYRRHFNTLSSQ